ncbi:MAG: outer membrane lipoprotein-sorting protein [Myxococcota bacterium]
MRRWVGSAMVGGMLLLGAHALAAPELRGKGDALDATSLVREVDRVFRGETALLEAAMTIERPRWTRTIVFRSWDDRLRDRALIRILDPRKDRGTGFLREGTTFWTYLPRVERTTRIPPSMMLQPWMGSDFTNDDLARESSLVEDYTAKLLGLREIDGSKARGIELLPRPEAPVVWSRIEVWVRVGDLAPLLETFYDEGPGGSFEKVRQIAFSQVKTVQGRPFPFRWEMTSTDRPDHRTTIQVREARFDEPFDDEIFTLENLKNVGRGR